MIFYLGEAVLFVALLLTSLQVLRMRRELQRMRAYHAEFQQVFGKTETALSAIQATIRELHASGREVVEELGQRIDAGRRLASDLKRIGLASEARRGDTGRNAA
ncbi:MAG: hypothetical protein Q8S58_20075 [Bosea sp. (in: a-proteobacteria)]|uniref:hypothetical protein n=1 Tax=Bosea sp. (in: a-proteobacteria) TaxID=1871050 RepID=UPI00273451E6|nr:hypothetical protein [Bosea sp. (in: a-proteobacteria)]MDP3256843.1 hypothetical protein [Bosea sp. (in: a-proteobacteria)]MDP3321428.1 hypothetical protein [Bosea sp. (in: a-proteobacteria)]